MSKRKHYGNSTIRQRKHKYTTLMSLCAFAATVTGSSGVASLTQHASNPCGAAMLAAAAIFSLGGVAANSQRQFYANKLKRRHASYQNKDNKSIALIRVQSQNA